jgi:signal transduction histidine kinase
MEDPGIIAVMDVLTGVFPAAHSVDRCLLELVLLRMANLSMEHGNCDSSSVAYSALNMVLGPRFADYGTAYDFGQLACELVDRRGMNRYEARVYSCVGSFAMPWTKPLPDCRPMLRRAFAVGTSIGDRAFAAYTFRHLVTNLLASGMPLADVQQEAETALAFAREAGLGLAAERFVGQLGLIHALRDSPSQEWQDDEWAKGDVAHLPGLAMIVGFHWVFKLQERYLAGDIPAALDAAERVAPIRWALRSCFEEAEYEFYAALTRAEACEGSSREQRASHLRALCEHLARTRAWRENCPETFAHREALLRAELMRLRGHTLDAERSYEEAIRLAHEHGFIQNAAIANELAARFYQARGFTTTADAYLSCARQCFAQWGAATTLRRFDARHPQLAAQPDGSPQFSTIDAPVAQLDAETVMRASQALSGEMVLPTLIEKLMRLAIEHAGAERGVLILLQGDEPHVEAEANTRAGAVEVRVGRARVTPADVPLAALQYTLRTRDRVVHDAASAADVGDDYLRRRRPRSVLCLPILKRAEVVGALYLENSLTAGVFTADRVAALDYVAAQAAISLENARLYSELRRSEAMLSEAQHLSATGSFLWRVATNEITWSEQNHRIFDADPSVPVTLELIATRFHEDDIAMLTEMVDRGRADDGDLDYEFRLRMPDGSVKYVHLRAHATRDKDGTLEYVGAIQDVSHQRRSDDAISKLRSELTHVARVTSLGVLTASIAHEVNQPLAGIMTNAGTCLRMLAAEPPNVHGAVETARRTIRDGERASAVIARLRALFAKEGAMSEWVDLNEATREVIALSVAELQSSRVVLRTELSDDLPPIKGDRVQLQQVILNLILNARDAMGSVDGRPRRLVIRSDLDDDGAVRVSVRDSGVGLEGPTREKLFEAFYTTKPEGMGIGLSVSRSIIERHRGQIWAAQNDGPGATFSFAIPCTAEAAEAAADASATSASEAVLAPLPAKPVTPHDARLW